MSTSGPVVLIVSISASMKAYEEDAMADDKNTLLTNGNSDLEINCFSHNPFKWLAPTNSLEPEALLRRHRTPLPWFQLLPSDG
jgi:hypothetical protein